MGCFPFFFFFWENNLSLTHHISYKQYLFLYPLQPGGIAYFGAYSLSQSHSKLSIFSLLFAFSLLSYSHCLSPSGLFSFHRSLFICLSQSRTLPCTDNISVFSTKTPILQFAFYVANDIYSNFMFLLVFLFQLQYSHGRRFLILNFITFGICCGAGGSLS